MDIQYAKRGDLRVEVEAHPAGTRWWRARVVEVSDIAVLPKFPWSPGITPDNAVEAAVHVWKTARILRRRRTDPPGP
ncbi:MAG TPA: hypothetical protein VF520_11035 [Thermoleophilaceae bacterium]|jgi:hypothetical protein